MVEQGMFSTKKHKIIGGPEPKHKTSYVDEIMKAEKKYQ